MAWRDIPDSEIQSEAQTGLRDITSISSFFQQIHDNVVSWYLGSGAAPKLNDAAFDPNSILGSRLLNSTVTGDHFIDETIGQTQIASAAVTQATLSTVTSKLDQAGDSPSSPGGMSLQTNPAGLSMLGWGSQYTKVAAGSVPTANYYIFGFAGTSETTVLPIHEIANDWSSEQGEVYLECYDTMSPPGAMEITIRYIDSSPPYNLGNGDIGHFAFALVDPITGRIGAIQAGPTPPWAYNGPTDTRPHYHRNGKGYQGRLRLSGDVVDLIERRAGRKEIDAALTAGDWVEVEVDHRLKNRDMHRIPHPFRRHNMDGYRVALIDPCSAMADDLAAIHQVGESVPALLRRDYIRLRDDVPDGLHLPPGVHALRAVWRDT